MKSATAFQHESWHDCLTDHLVLGLNELSDLALLVYAALGITYDIMIVFCSREDCRDLLCLTSVSLSSVRKPLKDCKGQAFSQTLKQN